MTCQGGHNTIVATQAYTAADAIHRAVCMRSATWRCGPRGPFHDIHRRPWLSLQRLRSFAYDALCHRLADFASFWPSIVVWWEWTPVTKQSILGMRILRNGRFSILGASPWYRAS